jgi:hypothetical protein
MVVIRSGLGRILHFIVSPLRPLLHAYRFRCSIDPLHFGFLTAAQADSASGTKMKNEVHTSRRSETSASLAPQSNRTVVDRFTHIQQLHACWQSLIPTTQTKKRSGMPNTRPRSLYCNQSSHAALKLDGLRGDKHGSVRGRISLCCNSLATQPRKAQSVRESIDAVCRDRIAISKLAGKRGGSILRHGRGKRGSN